MNITAPLNKVFKDNVHGYITIPKDIVELFIDTFAFQRLRQIEQTGMRVLYPTARHDRFAHSLGTYYLSVKASANLIKNIKTTYKDKCVGAGNFFYFCKSKKYAETFWKKYELLFTIASLLHDCAHAPFSHTLEFLYEYPCKKNASELTLRNKIQRLIGNKRFKNQFVSDSTPGAPHELMSSLIVINDYSDAVKQLLLRRGYNYQKGDIEFMVRAITGCRYDNEDIRSQIKDCFIGLLNSSYIDFDSLDYILRDATFSGMDNVSIDVERLLSALTVVEVEKIKDLQLNNAEIDADIIGIISDATMNATCKGIFKMNKCDGEFSGNLDISGSFKIKSQTEFMVQPNDSEYKIHIGSSVQNEGGRVVPNDLPVQSEISATTKDGNTLQIEGDVALGNNHNGSIKMKADAVDISLAHIKGTLSGKFNVDLIGNATSLGGTKQYRLGYYKSALSVMNNVIIARNYEYRWIYSHHKVVYSANYLLIDLIKKCLEYLEDDYETAWSNIFHWKTFIDKPCCLEKSNLLFYRPTDSDILNLFNYVFNKLSLENETELEVYKLLREFFNRKYRTSVWKSYSEFRQFFDFLTTFQKEQLKKIVCLNSKCYVKTKGEEYQYGDFCGQWKIKLEELGFFSPIWVNASSKMKSIDVAKTYIQFKDKTFTYKYAIGDENSEVINQLSFFYLYYRANPKFNPNIQGLKDFFLNEIKKAQQPE